MVKCKHCKFAEAFLKADENWRSILFFCCQRQETIIDFDTDCPKFKEKIRKRKNGLYN